MLPCTLLWLSGDQSSFQWRWEEKYYCLATNSLQEETNLLPLCPCRNLVLRHNLKFSRMSVDSVVNTKRPLYWGMWKLIATSQDFNLLLDLSWDETGTSISRQKMGFTVCVIFFMSLRVLRVNVSGWLYIISIRISMPEAMYHVGTHSGIPCSSLCCFTLYLWVGFCLHKAYNFLACISSVSW